MVCGALVHVQMSMVVGHPRIQFIGNQMVLLDCFSSGGIFFHSFYTQPSSFQGQ